MKITITGEITDKQFSGCYSPEDLKSVLAGLDEKEPLEVEITSEGGSVFAGIQIANLLARWKGNVTTHGVGLVASIATVILMAGKKVAIDENCFAMIHKPWTFTQGNADDLEKEIGNLEKCEAAMMGFYRKHSKVSDEELLKMLSDETWFLGSEFADVFDVEVVPNDQTLNIAAKFDLTKFHKVPEVLNMNKKEQAVVSENDDEQKKVEETVVEESTVEEPVKEEEKIEEEKKEEEVVEDTDETTDEEKEPEEKKEDDEVLNKDEVEEKFKEYEDTIEELQKRCAELEKELEEYKKSDDEEQKTEEEKEEESVSKAECEKRVSGMQASMQKQINDFKGQLHQREEELKTAKADIISLNAKLDESEKELKNISSALEEKTNALAMLNAGVNAHAEELPTMEEGLAKCASPAEKVAFLKSGKFVR